MRGQHHWHDVAAWSDSALLDACARGRISRGAIEGSAMPASDELRSPDA